MNKKLDGEFFCFIIYFVLFLIIYLVRGLLFLIFWRLYFFRWMVWMVMKLEVFMGEKFLREFIEVFFCE